MSAPPGVAQFWATVFEHEMRWQTRAKCADMDSRLFFLGKGQQPPERVRKTCSACPVQVDCLRHAIDHNETVGIWGGLTPNERKELRRRRSGASVEKA